MRAIRIVERPGAAAVGGHRLRHGRYGHGAVGACASTAAAAFDAYTACRGTGGFIIVDRISNATAAAGMVIDAVADASQHSDADELARLRAFEVELNALVRRYFPHWEAKDIVSKLA